MSILILPIKGKHYVTDSTLNCEYFYNQTQQSCSSSSLAQLRQKAHTKPKKNSMNLKCKHLQIFLTHVCVHMHCKH